MTSANDPKSDLWRWRFVIFVLAICLYLSGINPHWRISPDSGRYLTMARQLAEGKGYEYAGMSQYGIAPGLPALYAFLFRTSGFDFSVESLTSAFTVVNAAGALLAVLGILSAYLVAREMSGPAAALAVMALVAVSRYYFGNAFDALTDVPYCAASWASIYLLLRSDLRLGTRGAAAAVLLVAGVLLRIVGLALVAAVTALVIKRLLSRSQAGRKGAVGGLIVTVPAWCAIALLGIANVSARSTAAFSYYNMNFEGRTAAGLLLKAGGNLVDFLEYMFESAFGLNSIAGLWLVFAVVVAAGAVAYWRRGSRLAPLYMLFYLLMIAPIPEGHKVEARLLLPLLPFVYVFAFEGGLEILNLLQRSAGLAMPQRARRLCFIAIAVSVASANLANVGKMLAENHSKDFYATYARGKWADYIALGRGAPSLGAARRVMVLPWGPVHMLTGWEALRTPWRAPEGSDAARSLGDYVEKNGIGAIIEDSNRPDNDAETRLAFIGSGPLKWKELARFGRLVVYSIEEEAPREGPPPE